MSASLKKVNCEVCGEPILIPAGRGNRLKLCETHRRERVEKMQEMRQQRGTAQKPAGIVRVPSSPPSIGASDRTNPTVSPKGSFAEAVGIITASLKGGEGYRHGWLGNTGAGKTVGIKALLRATDTFTLIHDDTKLAPQYDVAPAACVTRFFDAPDDARTVLFRGDPFKGTVVEVEPLAVLTRQIAMSTRKPTRFVVDELDRACTTGGKELASPTLRLLMTQGRSMGISVVWSTQAPQRMPREIIDQSSTIAICQLGPRALNYLDERLCFDKEFLDAVPTLKTFQFVLYENGKPWNGQIYTSPLA